MRKLFLTLILSFTTFAGSMLMAQNVMTKQADGTYVVNTTELCKARGYKGYTPLEVHIKNNTVVKIVPLPHKETPKYYKQAATAVMKKFTDKKLKAAVKDANDPKIDGTTGATMTAKALQQNVKMALEYYKKNK